MALTQISTGGVKDNAVTAGKIPANAVGSSEIADDAVDQGAIADEAVDEARLQISNAGTNGQFLQKQSGNTGGLTWAAANEYTHPNHSGEVTSSADGAQTIATNVVDEDNLKISNAGTNGQFLQKQSGNTGGLTWADVTIPPAGNTVELVADGAIAAGKPVIITSAGKVKQGGETITELTSQFSSPTSGSNGAQMSGDGSGKTFPFNSMSFSETSSVGGFFFRNYNTGNKLECREFNINSSGNAHCPHSTNIDLLPAANDNYTQISSCWEATNNKFIIVARRDSDNKSYMTWASVTPSSTRLITASGNIFDINNVSAEHPKCCDCGSGRVAAICDVVHSGVYENYLTMYSWNGSSNYTEGQGAFVADSGTSSNRTNHSDIAYHAAEGKIVCVYHNESNNVGCKIGTISGTGSSMNTSWGSEVTVASAAELPKVVVDVDSGKVVVTYVYTSNNQIYSKVGTISGTSISFGSEVRIDTTLDADSPNNFRGELIYMQHLKKVVYGYVALSGGNYYTLTNTGTVSGTSITWNNLFQHWSTGTGIRGVTMVPLNDSARSKFVIGGRNDGNNDTGEFKIVDLTSATSNLNYLNIIGFAPSAINDGATGTIHLSGNTVDNQSSLTPATRYYVQSNGSLGTTKATVSGTQVKFGGIALSSSKLLISENNY